MPNHVHLIATPKTTDGLRLAIGKAHRRYARHVNLREGWRGYLWQGRFASFHWMAATWLRPHATSSSTPSGRAWWRAPRIGRGAAPAPIWRRAATGWSQ